MRISIYRFAPFTISVLLFLIVTFKLNAQNTVIKAGHLFDSQTGKVLKDQVIIIKNGRIQQTGPNLKYEEKDILIDLSTSWVLPGLMDCHVHITSNYPYRMVTGIHDIYARESSAFR